MNVRTGLLLIALARFIMPAQLTSAPAQQSLSHYQVLAQAHELVLELPNFETTPAAIHAAVQAAINRANRQLDAIGALKPGQYSFGNTARALDDMWFQASQTGNRLELIKETSPDARLREAATEALKRFEEWTVALDYRQDVYRAVEAYAETNPKLNPEDAKLLSETLRDYRRAGLTLPESQRNEVEELRKALTRLSTDFDSNITAAQVPLKFTKAELEGIPESFFSRPGIKTGNDEYTVMVNVTWQRLLVLENAKSEAVRRRVKTTAYRLAMNKNVALLTKIVLLRNQIAEKLGYASWGDFRTEIKMAGTARAAMDFLEKLERGLQPKFEAELAALKELKINETGDPDASIHLWDWRYYANQLKRESYQVDTESLRVYFPYRRVLNGMFDIYQKIFGLEFKRVDPPYAWVDDLELHVVLDTQSGKPLGMFYLDMFPRVGKYNHFAHFSLIEGKRLTDGRYQRPVSALICNFPPPSGDRPSLLSLDEVETLFHEFGHAMHALLTQANHVRFSGTSVPRDFVEAPSQMLEKWALDKTVLDSFAADYRDPSRKIPADIVKKLDEVRKADIALFYRRQLSFGLLDLALHTQIREGGKTNVVELSNKILSEVFLPVPKDTAFVAHFGHLTGYDAGYYGYAWAAAFAADMATVFKNAPHRFLDETIGARLRKEIYEPGDSRPVQASVEAFLGRPFELQPFLTELGIE